VKGTEEKLKAVRWPGSGTLQVRDRNNALVSLFSSVYELNYMTREYPDVKFSETG
jgi:peptide subunit release factor RF-3